MMDRMKCISDLRLWQAGERWDDRLIRASAGMQNSKGDISAADDQLAVWRRAIDADDAGLFERRLKWAGLDQSTACSIFADIPAFTEEPAWQPAFERIRDAAAASAHGPADNEAWLAIIDSACGPAANASPFIHLWQPAAQQAWDDLISSRPADRSAVVIDDAAAHDAQLWLAGRMSAIAVRPLMERFTANRTISDSLMLALGEEPPQSGRDRYSAFIRAQAADRLTSLSNDFPVLPRLLAVTLQHWTQTLCELFSRLQDDAEIIADAFNINRPLQLMRLHYGAGDSHRGGRAVAILTLAGIGGPARIVYKPKDMRLEREYHRLVAEQFGTPCGQPPVQAVAVGEAYGYVTYVEHRPADSEAQLAEFYRNAGRLLALLHLLGATDCHYENIVACADMPVLIDPETLFASRIQGLPGVEETRQENPDSANNDLSESVLRIGMLPLWQFSAAGHRATDISALGVENSVGQQAAAMRWLNINTDAMAWGARPAPLPSSRSLPVAANERNPLPRFVDKLVDGFLSAGRQLTATDERHRLTKRLANFTGMRRRMVLRATRVYGIMEQRLFRPEFLRSAPARGLELDRLSRSALLCAQPSPHWEFFLAELHDMEDLDIPYFDHALGSLDLNGGGRLIRNALAEDGLDSAIKRTRQVQIADFNWQAQLIRAAIGSRSYQESVSAAPVSAAVPAGNANWRDGERAKFFSGMLDALEQAEVRDAFGRSTWLSFGPLGDGMQAGVGFMDNGFYSGRAGLIAFLGMLSAAGIDQTVTERAAKLIMQLWPALRETFIGRPEYEIFRTLRDGGLGMVGAGGVLRMLAQPGLPVPTSEVKAIRDRILEVFSESLINKDDRLDVISGIAGSVGPLIDQPGSAEDDRIRTTLRMIADHLLVGQDAQTGGWFTPIAPRPLTGYAHGASGIGLALLRAGVSLKDERCLAAGVRAFGYERSQFDQDAGNWFDLRPQASARFMVAWCHGAAGIGLARARAIQLLPDHPEAAQWRKDVDRAGTTVAASPLLSADHLCCGNAGRSAALRALGRWTGNRTFIAASEAIDGAMLANWRATGSVRFNDRTSGTTMGIAGFMTGIPGIGMHFLGGEADLALMAQLA